MNGGQGGRGAVGGDGGPFGALGAVGATGGEGGVGGTKFGPRKIKINIQRDAASAINSDFDLVINFHSTDIN